MAPDAMPPTSLAAGMTVFWLLALGGIVGSFLNVVIYRTPRGLSLLRPGSHCPHCAHAIRWYDNIPVISWLLLGGRCRHCRGPISPRYPAVEAGCALMFVVWGLLDPGPAGFLQLFRAAASIGLPKGPGLLGPGATAPLAPLVAACLRLVCHLTLLCTLLAHLLIRWDGNPTRARILVPAIVLGIAAGAAPGVRVVGLWPGLTGPLSGLAAGIAGLMVGWMADAFWQSRPVVAALGSDKQAPQPAASLSGAFGLGRGVATCGPLAAIGAVLGWQAGCVLWLLGLTGAALARLLPGRRIATIPIIEGIWLAGAAAWTLFWVALSG